MMSVQKKVLWRNANYQSPTKREAIATLKEYAEIKTLKFRNFGQSSELSITFDIPYGQHDIKDENISNAFVYESAKHAILKLAEPHPSLLTAMEREMRKGDFVSYEAPDGKMEYRTELRLRTGAVEVARALKQAGVDFDGAAQIPGLVAAKGI